MQEVQAPPSRNEQEIKDELMCKCVISALAPHRAGKCAGMKVGSGLFGMGSAVVTGGAMVAAVGFVDAGKATGSAAAAQISRSSAQSEEEKKIIDAKTSRLAADKKAEEVEKAAREIKDKEEKERRIAERDQIEYAIKVSEENAWKLKESILLEKLRADRAEKERIEKDIANEAERVSQERDNQMCTCPLTYFSPHRYGKCAARSIAKGISESQTEEERKEEKRVEEAREKQKTLDNEAKDLKEKEEREKEWADRLNNAKKMRDEEERTREEADSLLREKEDSERESSRIKAIEERERMEDERLTNERTAKNAARESEERGLAAAAAVSKEESDNKMCSCTLAKFAPHRAGKCVSKQIGKGVFVAGAAAAVVGSAALVGVAVSNAADNEINKEKKEQM